MATINVYRYDYYDPVLKHERRSVDYATGDAAITAAGAATIAAVTATIAAGAGATDVGARIASVLPCSPSKRC